MASFCAVCVCGSASTLAYLTEQNRLKTGMDGWMSRRGRERVSLRVVYGADG